MSSGSGFALRLKNIGVSQDRGPVCPKGLPKKHEAASFDSGAGGGSALKYGHTLHLFLTMCILLKFDH